MEDFERLKFILRESEMPMFTDQQIQDYLQHCGSFDEAAYELLMMKSENTGIEIQGMTIQDTSSYFKRLALAYRPHNSGVLGG